VDGTARSELQGAGPKAQTQEIAKPVSRVPLSILAENDGLVKVLQAVTPAPGFRRDRVAGVQKFLVFLDSGFRRNDIKGRFLAFYETVKHVLLKNSAIKIKTKRFHP
jgi:hypothetical protein